MNKKGVEISLNFIIIAALALIALIVIALFFLGGAEQLFSKEEEISQLSSQTIALAKTTCSMACSLKNKQGYNNPSFPKELIDNGINNCQELYNREGQTDTSYDDRCGDCRPMDSAPAGTICRGDTRTECVATTGCQWIVG